MRLATSKGFFRIFNVSILGNSIGFYHRHIKSNLKSVIPLRFTLEKNEIFRFPLAYRELKVLSGVAWVTIEQKDLILHSGEKIELKSNKDTALISGLGKMPLVLEIL